MNKRWKTFAIVCASIMGFGIVLCIAGCAIGATNGDVRAALQRGFGFAGLGRYETHTSTQVERVDGDFEMYEEDLAGVSDIEVDVCKVQVFVQPTDEEKVIRVENSTDERLGLRVYMEGSTLNVETNDGRHVKNDGGSITIYIPKGMLFEQAEFSVGAGRIQIEEMNAAEFDLDAGAGEIVAKNIAANDISISCGAGSVMMETVGREADYNYEVEVGMGAIKIGKDEFAGMGMEKEINNGGARNMELECGMGRVEVTFLEEI